MERFNTKLGEVQMLFDKAEEMGWSRYHYNDNVYGFGKYSSAGQDFNISLDTEGDPALFLNNIYERYSNFDVSEEASYWLDEFGHGKSGAPYDMKDVYEDMEECRDNILELYNGLKDYYYREIYGCKVKEDINE